MQTLQQSWLPLPRPHQRLNLTREKPRPQVPPSLCPLRWSLLLRQQSSRQPRLRRAHALRLHTHTILASPCCCPSPLRPSPCLARLRPRRFFTSRSAQWSICPCNHRLRFGVSVQARSRKRSTHTIALTHTRIHTRTRTRTRRRVLMAVSVS